MISAIKLMNTNYSNQKTKLNNSKAQNPSFKGIHALELPTKYGITNEHQLGDAVIENLYKGAHELINKFYAVVKKASTREELEETTVLDTVKQLEGKTFFVLHTGEDSLKVAGDYANIAGIKAAIVKLSQTDEEVIKSKGIMYKVDDKNEIVKV